jgi:hypothetical protein
VIVVCVVRFMHRAFFPHSMLSADASFLSLDPFCMHLDDPFKECHVRLYAATPFLLMNDEMWLVSSFRIATALKILRFDLPPK